MCLFEQLIFCVCGLVLFTSCSWVLFDDDTLHIKKGDDILNLSGGGDWHMAYLLQYRAITVPKAKDD